MYKILPADYSQKYYVLNIYALQNFQIAFNQHGTIATCQQFVKDFTFVHKCKLTAVASLESQLQIGKSFMSHNFTVVLKHEKTLTMKTQLAR